MWHVLKQLWLAGKLANYERKIVKCTQARAKLKAKQARYTEKYEECSNRLNQGK